MVVRPAVTFFYIILNFNSIKKSPAIAAIATMVVGDVDLLFENIDNSS